MILAVAGTKGAPGATTLCLGVASLFRARRAVIFVEADPEGGCLAARLQIPQEPGLGTLAAAGRHDLSQPVFAGHLQSLPGGPAAIVAPSSPTHARTSLRAVAAGLGRVLLSVTDVDVVMDLGRLDAESPSLPLAAAADRLVFVGRPTLEGADAVAVRMVELGELRRRSSLVTVGDGPYDAPEVARILAVDHDGHLPQDDEGAALLWSEADRALHSRRPLVRALVQISEHLKPKATATIDASSVERPRMPGRRHLAHKASR